MTFSLVARDRATGAFGIVDLFVEPCGRVRAAHTPAPASGWSRRRTSPTRRSAHSRSTRSPAAPTPRMPSKPHWHMKSSPTTDS